MKTHQRWLLALASAAFAAGCSAGGQMPAPNTNGHAAAANGASPADALAPNHRRHKKVNATLVIRFHHRRRRPPGRHPNYISPNTASIGATVAIGAGPPSQPVYVNVSTCPQQSGITTCTLVVAAQPGSDTFAVSTYDQPNGGGSLLSTGSLVATITLAQNNITVPLVLDGVVHSIVLSLPVTTLPLGESQTLIVSAKDASSATIVGTYDNPITLSSSNLTFSPANLPGSSAASSVGIRWNYGFAGPASDTITASDDGHQTQLSLAPATGFALYGVGTSAAYDTLGFAMTTGPDGNLYYTTFGPSVCINEVCEAVDGALGQFNPTTHAFSEIELHDEPVQPYFATDGSLWVNGSTYGQLFRLPPSTFGAGSLQTIAVPSPASGTARVRVITDDGTNLWFTDLGGHRVLSVPLADPTTSAIVPYALPHGPVGTPQYAAEPRGIAYGADGNVYVLDGNNGVLDQVNTTTGPTGNQYVLPAQVSAGSNSIVAGFLAAGPSGQLYATYAGDTPVNGGMASFSTGGLTFSAPSLPPTNYAGLWALTISGNSLYYTDLDNGGLGYIDLSSGKSRLYPITAQGSTDPAFATEGETVAPDGTVWYTCYGSAGTPLCLGHAVYLSAWSVFPSQSIELFGTGSQSSQAIGLMEAPASDSGPFTASSSDTSVCTAAPSTGIDHNFVITGQAAGTCTITVTDAHSIVQTISVGVTATAGTITLRHHRAKRIEL